MAGLSLGAAAEQTRNFMRREAALVLPVAFATFGLALILIGMVTPERQAGQEVEAGLWSLAVIPLMFLALTGQLAISYLALRPGVTVREALAAALTRLPTALAIILLMVAALVALGLLLSVVLAIVAVAIGAGVNGAAMGVASLGMIFMFILGARLLMVWPLMADRGVGAVAAIKQALALSRGYALRFVAMTFAFAIVYLALTGAVQLGLGSLLLIFGKLAGLEGAATFLTMIIVSLLGAAIQAYWAVLLSFVYRQLAAAAPARA